MILDIIPRHLLRRVAPHVVTPTALARVVRLIWGASSGIAPTYAAVRGGMPAAMLGVSVADVEQAMAQEPQ